MAQKTPVTPEGNLEFSAFQNRVFEDIFPDFTYEFCTTSQTKLSKKGELLDITTVLWNLPDECLISYMQGRALNYTHVCRSERLEDYPFFTNHCLKFGIHQAMSVGFLNPGHESTFLSFDYMGDKNNIDWIQFDHVKIELASFPFAFRDHSEHFERRFSYDP